MLEFWRGTSARRAIAGESIPRAFGSLIARNRRRYGGYIVHAAIVLLAIGIAGSSAYQTVREKNLSPGPVDDDRRLHADVSRDQADEGAELHRVPSRCSTSSAAGRTSPRSIPARTSTRSRDLRTRRRSTTTRAPSATCSRSRRSTKGVGDRAQGAGEAAREPDLARRLRLRARLAGRACGRTRSSSGGSPSATSPPRSRRDCDARARRSAPCSPSPPCSSSRCRSCASRRPPTTGSTSRESSTGGGSRCSRSATRRSAALKELEFDHRTGKIADDDYRALVGPLRRRAAEALRALEPRRAAESRGPRPEQAHARRPWRGTAARAAKPVRRWPGASCSRSSSRPASSRSCRRAARSRATSPARKRASTRSSPPSRRSWPPTSTAPPRWARRSAHLTTNIHALESRVGDVSLAAVVAPAATSRSTSAGCDKLDELFRLQTARYTHPAPRVPPRGAAARPAARRHLQADRPVDPRRRCSPRRASRTCSTSSTTSARSRAQDKQRRRRRRDAKHQVAAARAHTRAVRAARQGRAAGDPRHGRSRRRSCARSSCRARAISPDARSAKSQALAATKEQIQQEVGESEALASRAQRSPRGSSRAVAGRDRHDGSTSAPAGAPSFIWPVAGPITSPFGMRWGTLHPGIDIGVPTRHADPRGGRRQGHLVRLGVGLRQPRRHRPRRRLRDRVRPPSRDRGRVRPGGAAGRGDRLLRLHRLLHRPARPLRGARERHAGRPARLSRSRA